MKTSKILHLIILFFLLGFFFSFLSTVDSFTPPVQALEPVECDYDSDCARDPGPNYCCNGGSAVCNTKYAPSCSISGMCNYTSGVVGHVDYCPCGCSDSISDCITCPTTNPPPTDCGTPQFQYDECISCNTSRAVYQDSCGTYSVGENQSNTGCSGWCTPDPPAATPAPPLPPAPGQITCYQCHPGANYCEAYNTTSTSCSTNCDSCQEAPPPPASTPHSPTAGITNSPAGGVVNNSLSFTASASDVDSNLAKGELWVAKTDKTTSWCPTTSTNSLWCLITNPVPTLSGGTQSFTGNWTPPASGSYYAAVNAYDNTSPVQLKCGGNPWCNFNGPNSCAAGSQCVDCEGWTSCGPNGYKTVSIVPLCGNVSNLSPSGTINPGSQSLTWTNASGATQYGIRIDDLANGWTGNCTSLNSGDFCKTNATSGSQTFNFLAGHTYRYWIYSSGNCNTPTDTQVNVTVTNPTAPAQPTGLTSTCNPAAGTGSLSWNASLGADRYVVYFNPATTLLNAFWPNTSYPISSPGYGASYEWGVQACNANGCSAKPTATMTCPVAPAATIINPSCQVSSGSVIGNNITVSVNEARVFRTDAQGSQLNATALYWSGDNANGVYNLMEVQDCSGLNYTGTAPNYNCNTQDSRIFTSPGSYYVVCTASNTLGNSCSGAPYYIDNGTYPSCGTNSIMVVNVTAPASSATSPWIQVTGDVHSNTGINAGGGP